MVKNNRNDEFFTSHTVYVKTKRDIGKVMAPGCRVTEKVEVATPRAGGESRGRDRMWKVTFLTPTHEGFLVRMGVVAGVAEAGDKNAV